LGSADARADCLRANVSKGYEYPLKRSCVNNLVCAYWAKIQCFDIKADNRLNLATIWKVFTDSSSHGELSVVGLVQ